MKVSCKSQNTIYDTKCMNELIMKLFVLMLSLMCVASYLWFYFVSYCLYESQKFGLMFFFGFEMARKKSNAKSTSLKLGYQMTTVAE